MLLSVSVARMNERVLEEERPASALQASDESPLSKDCHMHEEKGMVVIEEDTSYLDSKRAWIVAIGCFLIYNQMIGVQFAFGVFQRYYLSQGLAHNSALSMIGTVQASIMQVLGFFAGYMAERIGYRPSMALGCFLWIVGLLLCSFSTKVWQLILCFGVLGGVGGAFLDLLALSATSSWFLKKHGLALGICTSGSALGGILYSVVIDRLIVNFGVAWTWRILALITGVLMCIGTACCKESPKAISQKGTTIKWKKVLSWRFGLLSLVGLVMNFGFLVPYFYIPLFSETLGMSDFEGAFMLSLFNVGSVVGRFFGGVLADSFLGPVNSFTATVFGAGVSVFIWAGATTRHIFIAFVLIAGLFNGGLISLFFTVGVAVFSNDNVAQLMGLLFTPWFVGEFASAPIFGAIVDNTGPSDEFNSYLPAIYYTGTIYAAAFILMLILRFMVNPKVFTRV